MKSLSRTMLVVVALFAGAVFGSMSTGCFAVWLGAARADGDSYTTTTAQCVAMTADGGLAPNPGGYAVQSYPGLGDSEIAARVTAFARVTATVGGFPSTGRVVAPYVGNGVAFVPCVDDSATEVEFTIH